MLKLISRRILITPLVPLFRLLKLGTARAIIDLLYKTEFWRNMWRIVPNDSLLLLHRAESCILILPVFSKEAARVSIQVENPVPHRGTRIRNIGWNDFRLPKSRSRF